MSRFQNLLCFTILLVTVTFFNGATAVVKIKPALPKTGDPIIVGDVEPYTVKVVSAFVADLEKECAKTEKFKMFFEKINDFSKYVCSVSKVKDNGSQMKAKAGSLFQAIADLGTDDSVSKGGKVNKLQKEKTEAMETVKMLQSIGEKITGGQNNKTEINETLKLTTKQQKEVKDGVLKWLEVITKIAKKADETSMKSSSKSETKKESKDDKSSTKSDKKSDKQSKSKDDKSSTKSDKKFDKQSKSKDEKSSKKSDNNSDKKSKDEKSSPKSDKKSDKESKDDKSPTKSDKNSDKEKDNKKNKKDESKKKKDGGKEGGSAKSKGGSDDDKSSKNKGKGSENADKNKQTKDGKADKKKEDFGPFRSKEERLKAEEADEYD